MFNIESDIVTVNILHFLEDESGDYRHRRLTPDAENGMSGSSAVLSFFEQPSEVQVDSRRSCDAIATIFRRPCEEISTATRSPFDDITQSIRRQYAVSTRTKRSHRDDNSQSQSRKGTCESEYAMATSRHFAGVLTQA